MRRVLVIVVCCCAIPAARAEELLPDGSPLSGNGGLIIMRQGNQTTVSLGGVLFPRQVRVKTATPEGPVITRFTLPANVRSPTMPDWLGAASPRPAVPATLRVDIPDQYGLLYVEDVLVRSEAGPRLLQSPPLSQGQPCPVRLRAVFAAGDKLLIEEKQVVLRAGESIAVTFDGSGAIAVALPKERTSPALPAGKRE